jgi:protein-S-isoprenylcysteine O-methyltransferase Ste14
MPAGTAPDPPCLHDGRAEAIGPRLNRGCGLPEMFQQELARTGHRLFIIRGHFIRLIILIGIGVAYLVRAPGPFANPDANIAWFWVSLAVALAGALFRMYTNGHAANGTSSRVKVAAEAAELNTTGAYSFVRNPLYVGRILNFTGLAMLSGSAVYGMLIYFVSVLVYERISAYEEEFLKVEFGETHTRWASEVPALLPRFHGYVPPKYPMWWRRLLWREYKKVFQLGTALFFYYWAWHGFDLDWMRGQTEALTAYGALIAVRIFIEIIRAGGFFKDMR